jgi:hypothetical protein
MLDIGEHYVYRVVYIVGVGGLAASFGKHLMLEKSRLT